jgi:hypothetical protein
MGTFSVGNARVSSTTPWEMYVPESQSRGGTTSEGRGRTIVDIAGPGNFDHLGYLNSDDTGTAYSSFGQTSSATPAVAGGAALFQEWYLDKKGTLVEDPGVLYTNLLLMGDRDEQDGTPETSNGFDNLWGAGLMHLRMFESSGLDGPARWVATSRCVDNNEDETLGITSDGSNMLDDVEAFKAVIWWYDTKHDQNNPQDDISFRLQFLSSGGTWLTNRSDTSDDNKKRVLRSNLGTSRYRLQISGDNVTSDFQGGCGWNSMRVYVAFFYEDSDRETITNIRKEFP